MSVIIWWIRRDLRLSDNQALTTALSSAEQVIPAFIIDPKLVNSPNISPKRLAFLWGGLYQLDAALRTRGSRMIVRYGTPRKALVKLIEESGAEGIIAENDFTPYAGQRDRAVAERAPLQLVGGPSLSHPDSVLKSDGTPYVVYSPYMREWKARFKPGREQLLPSPEYIPTPVHITSEPVPRLSDDILFKPGEVEAQKRLRDFTEGFDSGIYDYADQRNQIDLDSTSKLSPYLRFGMLSARQATVAAYESIQKAPENQGRRSGDTWLNELIWREFYMTILYHHPFVLRRSFRPDLQDIPWNTDTADFESWCQGRTGYPVVDAAMRQLAQMGWIHNRARMIVASFLVKDLLIDWRWGERWFMQHLIDGDLAANNGGWQWIAGTGTDAAPYFRIFNPILQGNKFDPKGEFVHQWVPELVNVPLRYIHTPWMMPPEQQRHTGCIIGQDYPAPLIEHSFARERTLAAYNQARQLSKDKN